MTRKQINTGQTLMKHNHHHFSPVNKYKDNDFNDTLHICMG